MSKSKCKSIFEPLFSELTDEDYSLINENARLRAELAKYREAEKQGWLAALPCKAGDKVYRIYHDSTGALEGGIDELEVDYLYVDKRGVGISVGAYDGHVGGANNAFVSHWMPLPEPPKENK